MKCHQLEHHHLHFRAGSVRDNRYGEHRLCLMTTHLATAQYLFKMIQLEWHLGSGHYSVITEVQQQTGICSFCRRCAICQVNKTLQHKPTNAAVGKEGDPWR